MDIARAHTIGTLKLTDERTTFLWSMIITYTFIRSIRWVLIMRNIEYSETNRNNSKRTATECTGVRRQCFFYLILVYRDRRNYHFDCFWFPFTFVLRSLVLNKGRRAAVAFLRVSSTVKYNSPTLYALLLRFVLCINYN